MDKREFEKELKALKTRVLNNEKNINTFVKLFEDVRIWRRMSLTDIASTEQLLRIIWSIPLPQIKPLKIYVE